MDFRRFEMERADRLSSPSVREKLWFACSLKMRSEVVRFAIVAVELLRSRWLAINWGSLEDSWKVYGSDVKVEIEAR